MDRGDGLGGGAIFSEPLLAVGVELAGYRIESLLGRGGMGVVYRAHDLALDRKLALKLLAPELARDVRFRERFLRESRLAAALDHPAIVPIYDAGEVAGQLYIAMRLVAGADLKRLLAEEGTLEPTRALALIGQVADALDAAHERGLVHRDVKPSNVLIDERGHCYLADFGLSRRLNEQAPGADAGRSLGTVEYVAPEQIRGDELDGRADLYSLGCLLYECLAGRPPFTGGSLTAIAFAHLQQEPPILPKLEGVMRTALAKEPDDRYQSGRELVAAARLALGLDRPRRARWPIAAGAIGVGLIGATLLAFFLTRTDGRSRAEPGADSLVRIDPNTNRITGVMPVGRMASGVAATPRYVWVTSMADGTVWRITAKTKATLTVAVGGTPTGVAATSRATMVAEAPEHSLVSLDTAVGSVSYVTRLSGDASSGLPVAVGREGLWFADATRRSVGQVDLSAVGGGAATTEIHVPANDASFLTSYQAFDGLSVGEGGVWAVGDAFGRTLWRLDPRSARVVATISLPFIPGSVATGLGAVWVSSLLGDTLVRIDPATDRIAASIHVGGGVDAIAAGDGAVWVAGSRARVVSRIDPRTDQVVAQVRMAGTPTHIAVGAGSVWLTTAKPTRPVPRGTIGIGVLADCRGPFGSWYDQSLAGAELAFLEHGARPAGPAIADGVTVTRIAGKPVALVLGCTDGTATSLLTEARRLVAQAQVRILIAATGGSEGLALEAYARRQPGVALLSALAGAQELNPPRNVFSFNPDGAEWMAGLGTYAYRTLGWRRAVTVGDIAQGLFNTAQIAGFTGEFCALGGTIVRQVWVPPGTEDYSSVISQIPATGVDGIVTATGAQTLLALASEYRGLRRNLSRRLILGANTGGPALGKLGPHSSRLLLAGYWLLTPGPAGRRYQAELKKAFPSLGPGIVWDIAYYDAMTATFTALMAVHGDLSDGERRFRAALARVRLSSPTGPIQLDSTRQAIGPNYLVRLDGSLYRRIGRVEPTFGGYFTAHDPPPSERSPICKRHAPPPWAR